MSSTSATASGQAPHPGSLKPASTAKSSLNGDKDHTSTEASVSGSKNGSAEEDPSSAAALPTGSSRNRSGAFTKNEASPDTGDVPPMNGSGRARSGAATGSNLPAPGDHSTSPAQDGTGAEAAGSSKAGGGTEGSKTSATPPTENGSPALTASAVLANIDTAPFVIKAYLLSPTTSVDAATTAEATGTILSKTIKDGNIIPAPGKDAGVLSLSNIRKLIPAMSRFSKIHKFCTPSGILLDDETLTFKDYLAMEPEPAKTATGPTGTPSVGVYYRPPAANPIQPVAGANDPKTSAPAISTALTAASADALKAELKTLTLESMIKNNTPFSAGEKGKNAGSLTEAEWALVLRNCGVFFGWVVDPLTKAIRRAPKAAFQLRADAGISRQEAESSAQSKSINADQETKTGAIDAGDKSVVADSSSTTSGQISSDQTKSAAKVVSATGADGTPVSSEKNTSGSDALGNGVVVDQADVSTKRFQDETMSSSGATTNSAGTNSTISNRAPELPSERAARLAQEEIDKQKRLRQTTGLDVSLPNTGIIPPKVYSAIPTFRVNDDSKIDISVCKHELALSMAKNDFSSQSTEASVSGGAFGVTVGVSAGYASSKSSGHAEQQSESTQFMVARYMYPRCDLLLNTSDLEPTPELRALLEKIRTTKSIRALRSLQADYGQLFCQELTLGARLMSTQTMSTRFKGSSDEQKEQFKVSVGVSVSTPYGGASVKHEEEKGHSEENKKSESSSNESNIFEAVGGDTILANNPPEWAKSVSSHETWRVINRGGLSSLIQMLVEIPGFAGVQSWFVQAVPAMSKYLTLDDSHTVTTRLKVLSPTNSLHIENTNGKARHYLGFQNDAVSPCLNTTDTTIINGSCPNFWIRIPYNIEKRLFEPQTFKAPVIRGFDNYDVQGAKYGNKFNDSFAAVTWDIIAPFTDVISHGSRVILRTKPTDTNTSPTHMVVFRNAQGEFLPGMSDRDTYQYWRIVKAGSDSQSASGPIQAGDEVRLCWSFKDQTTGYRSYADDVFGRRETRAPNGVPDVLYLKVPWPRFENSGHATAMILSPDASTSETVADVTTVQGTFKYALQDLRFRLDTVENDGHGDADDYLLQNVTQEGDKTTVGNITVHLPGDPFQMQRSIWMFGIRV